MSETRRAKPSNRKPTLDEIREVIKRLKLWKQCNEQHIQLPLIVTMACYPEYFGLGELSERSILDIQSEPEATADKNKNYECWVTDVMATVEEYSLLCQRGSLTQQYNACTPLFHINNHILIECKPDAWDFIRTCAGIERQGTANLETRCRHRGHIVRPLSKAVQSEPRYDRVEVVVVESDDAIQLNSGGNPKRVLTNLTEGGVVNESYLSRMIQTEIRAAPIIREMGIPCVVVENQSDIPYKEVCHLTYTILEDEYGLVR